VELKDARGAGLDAWTYIGTTHDLRLMREQQLDAQAMGMAVAQSADVCLGNGVSVFAFWFEFGFLLILESGFRCLTLNVVMFRAAQGFE
jgi:hypothetical protein